jgi:hypothetical protein
MQRAGGRVGLQRPHNVPNLFSFSLVLSQLEKIEKSVLALVTDTPVKANAALRKIEIIVWCALICNSSSHGIDDGRSEMTHGHESLCG